MMRRVPIILDSLYGFIELTEAEEEIIDSPFFQRLRWLKQLGFSNYIFPGGEHTRFSHALGTLHIADLILRALGKAVSAEKLFNPKARGEPTMFHRAIRIAAMLHDIGQFPFSHTIEESYIEYEKKRGRKSLGDILAGSHEEISTHIITQTKRPGGITHILEKHGFDPNFIAQIAAGTSPNLLANQLLHSDIDCDRIDYLLRDAHHTGVKYGQFDWHYLINSFRTYTINGKEALAIHENALYAVEGFLMSRFSWYSQIIKDGTGAKFDFIATKIYEYFLNHRLVHSIEDIKKIISHDPHRFFEFNDHYFLNILMRESSKRDLKDPMIIDLINMLIYRIPPKEIKTKPFRSRIISEQEDRQKLIDDIMKQVAQYKKILRQEKYWVLVNIPAKDIKFTRSIRRLKQRQREKNLLEERDPIKILDNEGNASLLVERDTSLLRFIAEYRNFIPAIYVSEETYNMLKEKGCF